MNDSIVRLKASRGALVPQFATTGWDDANAVGKIAGRAIGHSRRAATGHL